MLSVRAYALVGPREKMVPAAGVEVHTPRSASVSTHSRQTKSPLKNNGSCSIRARLVQEQEQARSQDGDDAGDHGD